jgi:hypothetical protein
MGKEDKSEIKPARMRCHRCKERVLRPGGFSALIEASGGHKVRRYVCERCCIELSKDWRTWV